MQGDGEGGVIVRGIKEPCGRVVHLTTHLSGHTARSRLPIDNFDGEANALYRIPSSGGKLARKQALGSRWSQSSPWLDLWTAPEPGNCLAGGLPYQTSHGIVNWQSRQERSLAVWPNPRPWPGCRMGTPTGVLYRKGSSCATGRAFDLWHRPGRGSANATPGLLDKPNHIRRRHAGTDTACPVWLCGA
jgi:hypothetical protein